LGLRPFFEPGVDRERLPAAFIGRLDRELKLDRSRSGQCERREKRERLDRAWLLRLVDPAGRRERELEHRRPGKKDTSRDRMIFEPGISFDRDPRGEESAAAPGDPSRRFEPGMLAAAEESEWFLVARARDLDPVA